MIKQGIKEDQSYGIVPLRKKESNWAVFLVQHRTGHWAMPKGHPEGSESPLETAKRELFEETGLQIEEFLSDTPLIEEYQFQNGSTRIHKKVGYFVAIVTGQERLQLAELKDGCWFSFQEAFERVTFSEARSILRQTMEVLDL